MRKRNNTFNDGHPGARREYRRRPACEVSISVILLRGAGQTIGPLDRTDRVHRLVSTPANSSASEVSQRNYSFPAWLEAIHENAGALQRRDPEPDIQGGLDREQLRRSGIAPPDPPRLPWRPFALLLRILERLTRALRIGPPIAALSRLDEKLLQDLGTDRTRIGQAVQSGRNRP